MAAPSIAVTDNFNRASLGANWSTYTAAGSPVLLSASTYIDSDGGYKGSYYNASTVTRPCEAYITLRTNLDGTSGYFGLKFIDTPGNNAANDDGYYIGTDTGDSPSDSMKLYRIDNGAETQIPTSTEHATTWGTNSRWAIQLEASAVKLWSDEGAGWVERISTTDTTYSLTFNGVVDIFGADPELDDFAVGNISAAASASLLARPRPSLYKR